MQNPAPTAVIVQEVERLARQFMGEFGLTHVITTSALDHDGDAVLAIELQYDPAGPAVDTTRMTDFFHTLRRRLRDMGEDRFPHVRHDFALDRKVVGFP